MIRENLTDAVEDYLKAIYMLTLTDTPASTNQIAERMGVTPASVTGMLKRLAANDPPLLAYNKHHGAVLTPAGRQVALEIIRHHRLLELYLHEQLGYPWEQVHAEADRLEHVISEDFEERIAQALGNPLSDPHGDPIPSRELFLPGRQEIPLNQLRTGQEAVVCRVSNEDPEFLRYIREIGLVPQTRLEVLQVFAFDGNLQLNVGTHTLVLGPRVTSQIFVESV